MVARAEAKYIRISPFKARLIIKPIKGINAKQALSILSSINKKGARYFNKVVRSAIANAKNKGFSEDNLIISRVAVNPGPTLKRWRAASFGRAGMIRKRTSHIIVELEQAEKIVS